MPQAPKGFAVFVFTNLVYLQIAGNGSFRNKYLRMWISQSNAAALPYIASRKHKGKVVYGRLRREFTVAVQKKQA